MVCSAELCLVSMLYTYARLLRNSTLAGQRNFRMMANYACECRQIIRQHKQKPLTILYFQHTQESMVLIIAIIYIHVLLHITFMRLCVTGLISYIKHYIC